MPNVLREHQHELNLPDDAGNGFVFGTEDTGYLTLTRPTTSAADQRNGDRDRPQEDGRMFGFDYRGAKTVVFEIGVITDHLTVPSGAHRLNLDYLDALEALWQHRKWRNSPDALAMLRSCEGGQTWRCYGRPRRYEESAGTLTQRGFTPIVADFALIDNEWYADVESVADVFLPSGIEGGLVAPVTAPLSSVQSTAGSASITVGGSSATWPVVEFRGPVLNPSLNIGTMVISLFMNIAAGEVVVYDPRPWIRSVYGLANNAGYAGAIAAPTPKMADTALDPGTYAVAFNGTGSGGASARLRWRNARTRP